MHGCMRMCVAWLCVFVFFLSLCTDWSAKNRWNFAIAAMLQPRSGSADSAFWVATYHTPCAFRSPLIMHTHVALLIEWAQRLANGAPLLVAGDFNIQPTSAEYAMVQSGVYDEAVFAHAVPPNDDWRPRLQPMRSALAQANGAEPDWTNYCFHGHFNSEFCGTLDYIFMSPHWRALRGQKHVDSDATEMLPNTLEPSDHCAISATVELQPARRS